MPNKPETSSEKKARRERELFNSFALAARHQIDIDPSTIASREPQAPDIKCATFSGEHISFELVELCPPELAKATRDDNKRGGGVSFVPTADPSRAILMQKLKKSYVCEEPIELLCYANGRLPSPDDIVLDELSAVLDEHGLGQFSRIWFFGEKGVYRVR